MNESSYRFRSLTTQDLPLISRWRATSHVIEWWGEPNVEDEREQLTDSRIAMWIVEYDGRPFAFAQDDDVHGWRPHHPGSTRHAMGTRRVDGMPAGLEKV